MVHFVAIGPFSGFGQRLASDHSQTFAVILNMLIVAFSLSVAGVVVGDAGPIGSCGSLNNEAICTTADGYCCSENNYCGNGAEYCGAGVCQIKYSSPRACAGDTGPSSSPVQTRIIIGGVVGAIVILCAVITFGIYYKKRRNDVSHRRRNSKKFNSQKVHLLYPKEILAEDEDTSCMDIVFCHGFAIGDLEKDAWRKTWLTSQMPFICWAEEWLGGDLQGNARIFSLAYDADISSDPRSGSGNNDVTHIAHDLLQCIFREGSDIGQKRAVVLIGHSFGGLVIKSLVVEAQRLAKSNARNILGKHQAQKCKSFLENVEMGGFIFYAVPHSGTRNLNFFIQNCDSLFKRKSQRRDNNPSHGLLSNIEGFSRAMEELSVKFEDFVRPSNTDIRRDDVIIYAFTEGRETEGLGMIVEHGSAVRLSAENHYKVESADHMNVCRFFSKDDEGYKQLTFVLEFIQKQLIKKSDNVHKSASLESEAQGLIQSEVLHGARATSIRVRSRSEDDSLP